MKVLLTKDVYKLGRAGDIRRVADGYGRNFLLPRSMAVLATAGAMKQIETIKTQATARRAALNQEMGSAAEVVGKLTLYFASKAGETGKLYGSITTEMITDAITSQTGVKVDRRMIDIQPIRTLGEHKARIRLTVDLMPEIKIIVHREGEAPAAAQAAPAPQAVQTAQPASEQTAEPAK